MKHFLLVFVAITPVAAIFFGGGGGGGGCGGCQSCCQAQPQCAPPPPPCAPPPPPCAPPPPPPQPCGCGGQSYGGSYGGSYAAAPPCRPRYIIVRPAESYASGGGYSSGGYSSGGQGGGYASAPQSYSAPVPVASYQPGPSYAPQPAPQPSYQPAPQQNYQPAPQQSYQQPAPVQQSYQSGPAPAPAPASYAGAGGNSYAHASKTVVAGSKCSSKELRIILENSIIPGDANESKRRIYATATDQIRNANGDKATVDVICAPAQISYRIATDLFCEYTKEDITCFAYQHAA
ncbi:Ground-like domain-containing protein [Aphelenchoides besseyi]|nr:Ground-like domain-containing protein [Aphelenchoides besseyi]KAI6208390.1 Ground-like domain-containing protein [Aphelenchoides besseyi]